MNEAFLLLGSNIDPEKNILLALEYLQQHFDLLEVSHTWQTKAVGSHSADFLNTAVRLHTELNAPTLKERCLCQIEENLGRVRQADKNAPRTIDLDIILFNGQALDQDLFRHAHLVLPFAELLPDLVDPHSGLTLAELSGTPSMQAQARKFKCLLPPFDRSIN